MSYETDRIAALEDLVCQEAIKTKALETALTAAQAAVKQPAHAPTVRTIEQLPEHADCYDVEAKMREVVAWINAKGAV
jgi:hypothetical protein